MLFQLSVILNSWLTNGVRKCTSLILTNLSTNTTWNLLLSGALIRVETTLAFKSLQRVSLVNHGLLLAANPHPVMYLRSLNRQLKLTLRLEKFNLLSQLWQQTLLVVAALGYLHVRFGLTMVGNSTPLTGALNLLGKLTLKTSIILTALPKSKSLLLAHTHGQVLPLCSQPPLPSMLHRPWPSERKLRINDWFGHQKTKD